MHLPDLATQQAQWLALGASLVAHADHYWRYYRSLKGALPMNPFSLIPAALTVAQDGAKLYQDLSGHDKPAAVAAVLDAVPALAVLVNKPEADLRAIITAETVGLAFDLEQDAVRVLPLIEAALAKAVPTA